MEKWIREERKKEPKAREIYMLVGSRFSKSSGALYNCVTLYADEYLKMPIYRNVRKFDEKEYTAITLPVMDKVRKLPSMKVAAEKNTIKSYWRGYYAALLGAKTILELLDDLKMAGIEKINWCVYGREGQVISAYLDNYFDLDYSYGSTNGAFDAGTRGRTRKYFRRQERDFASVCNAGVNEILKQIARHLEMDVLSSADVGVGRDESVKNLPYDNAKRLGLIKENKDALMRKARAHCMEEYVGVEWRGLGR